MKFTKKPSPHFHFHFHFSSLTILPSKRTVDERMVVEKCAKLTIKKSHSQKISKTDKSRQLSNYIQQIWFYMSCHIKHMSCNILFPLNPSIDVQIYNTYASFVCPSFANRHQSRITTIKKRALTPKTPDLIKFIHLRPFHGVIFARNLLDPMSACDIFMKNFFENISIYSMFIHKFIHIE